MTRSRRRKLDRSRRPSARRVIAAGVPLASVLAGVQVAIAQEQGGLEEVIVTAQKRSESLQNVPISVTALGNETLEQLRLSDFEDYARFLPSLSFTTGGPGFARVYFRGVAAGDNGNHSGSQPSVGIYLDEMPITTIQGALDLHLYDIARVEGLAGPQGTLYGASSQAGTVRIITNRPELEAFDGGVSLEGSVVESDLGYTVEGFTNIPLGESAAVRLVGWYKDEPGYIDNVRDVRVYQTASDLAGEEISRDNLPFVEEDYNDIETYGGRVAVRFDLGDRWTITPTVMAQNQTANGGFAFDPSLGDLEVRRFREERSTDDWWQAALSIEGKIANLDLVYAGGYLSRDTTVDVDYSDYSYFYDAVYGYYLVNDAGSIIDPSQYTLGKDGYGRYSHEIRISSPSDQRFRWVAGAFVQRQAHRIRQRYVVDDLAAAYSVEGWNDTIWLTQQQRVDRDRAIFGELTYDLTDRLTGTVGARYFETENELVGFYGFARGFSGSGTNGEARCTVFVTGIEPPPRPVVDPSAWVPYSGAPCQNLAKEQDEDGVSPKFNLTYRFDDDRMLYTTVSEGFRPGGANRRGTFPSYDADYLMNYEIGWKTSWAANTVRFNGAVFWQDWDDFQFSFLGENGLTNIVNARSARAKGVEMDLQWAATENLLIYGGVALLEAELTDDFCIQLDGDGTQLPPNLCDPADAATDGTQLPISPEFKGNITARYSFPLGRFAAHVQGSYAYEGERRSALLEADEIQRGGPLDAYGIADFSFGFGGESFDVELFVNNAFDETAELARYVQCNPCAIPYVVTNTPRQVGVKYTQRF
jgi:outer membrane receptor protein involved in Fe transport